MLASVTCPVCQHQYRLPEGDTGARQICPQCRSPFFVGKRGPGRSLDKTMLAAEQTVAPLRPPIKYNCPNCRKPLEAPAEQAGTKTNCPSCGQRLQIPAAPSGTPNLNRTMLAGSDSTPAANATPGAAAAGGGRGLDAGVAAVGAWLRRLTPTQAAIGGGVLLVLLLLVGFLAFRGGKADPEAVTSSPELEKLKREIEQKQAEMERHARAEADARKQIEEMLRKNPEDEERRREEERRRLRDTDDEEARARLQKKLEQEQQQRDRERQERERKTQQELEEAQRKLEETKRALEELQQKQPKGRGGRGGRAAVMPAASPVAPNPGTMQGFPIGQTFLFRVTGATGGAVWGTDVYTSDSDLGTAAVHAGILGPGQTGVVQVQTSAGLPAYAGSIRYGVSTSSYGPWGASYTISPAP
jgi:DNA-directed RNA polymerase subunit RPC12/RpoP